MVVDVIKAMSGGKTGTGGRRTNQQGQGGISQYDRRDNERARAAKAHAKRNQNDRRARNT